MINGTEYLDGFVKESLHGASMGAPSDGWGKLNSKLTRINFMKFTATRFNVYYLGTIIVGIALAAWLLREPAPANTAASPAVSRIQSSGTMTPGTSGKQAPSAKEQHNVSVTIPVKPVVPAAEPRTVESKTVQPNVQPKENSPVVAKDTVVVTKKVVVKKIVKSIQKKN